MTIEIKNQHIFFAVENCWPNLDYRFKYQLNSLVILNPDPDYIQTVTIDKPTFIQVMKSVNSQPQGIAMEINPTMYDALKAQVLQLAQQGDTEAIDIAQEMAGILLENEALKSAKIEYGKQQILA